MKKASKEEEQKKRKGEAGREKKLASLTMAQACNFLHNKRKQLTLSKSWALALFSGSTLRAK